MKKFVVLDGFELNQMRINENFVNIIILNKNCSFCVNGTPLGSLIQTRSNKPKIIHEKKSTVPPEIIQQIKEMQWMAVE